MRSVRNNVLSLVSAKHMTTPVPTNVDERGYRAACLERRAMEAGPGQDHW